MKLVATAVLVAAAAITIAACQATSTPESAEQPTEEQMAEPTSEAVEKTLYVASETAPCVGVAPMDCLQVKEDPDAEWQMFYAPIEGFEFEAGYEYELRVLVEPVPNPPADASSLRYTLIEVVSKTPVASEGPEPGAPLALEGPTWILASQGDPTTPIPVLAETQITATFEDGRVAGTSGCNRYFADYTVEEDQLTVGTAGSTMMACPDPIMEQEQGYLSALQESTSFAIVDDQLVITYGDGMALTFDAQPLSLDGTAWTVTAYNNGQQAVTSVISGTAITAAFAEGKIAGNAGCNEYNAPVEIDGSEISIGMAVTTRKMCAGPEGVMEQETLYLEALSTAATWRREGTKLELRTAEDAAAVTFIAAEPEE